MGSLKEAFKTNAFFFFGASDSMVMVGNSYDFFYKLLIFFEKNFVKLLFRLKIR